MEGSSGLIVAFVVVLWAAYFVPLVLRRYDDLSKNESVDEGSNRTTLTSSKTQDISANHKSAARVSTPQSTTRLQSQAQSPSQSSVTNEGPRISRQAAAVAARRRRNTLLTLVVALLAVVGVAAYGVIDWWWLAAPVSLIAAWLVACRIMVRDELGLGKPSLARNRTSASVQSAAEELTEEIYLQAPTARETSKVSGLWQRMKVSAVSAGTSVAKATVKATAKKPVPVTGADAEATIVVAHQFEEHDPDTRHVMEKDVPLAANALDEQLHIAVPSASVASGEPLWDPLPVTVPTYVTKPRAGRTVRTIDFSQAGTWTSGHVEGEQTELPGRNDNDATGTERKAVGH